MDDKTRGAWIIHHGQKLMDVSHLPGHDALAIASKAGLLLSALAESDHSSTLNSRQVQVVADSVGIGPLERDPLLKHLETAHLIKCTTKGVSVLGVSTTSVLMHTARMFDGLSPSSEDIASIDVAEIVSKQPRRDVELQQYVSDNYRLGKQRVKEFLAEAQIVGFLDAEPLDTSTMLYFNGNLFRRENLQKTRRVLDSLKPEEIRKVTEFENRLRSAGCLDLQDATVSLGEKLFEKLQAIAMFDVSTVFNEKENRSFVTHPAAFSKFGDPFADDALDLAKALVAALAYGMTRSPASRGRITMLPALLAKLIRGAEVGGPAPAIGEDYKFLELRRVVQIRRDGGQFYMRLLKPEIGQLALNVLTQGDASEQLVLPGSPASSYFRPEQQRVKTRKKVRVTGGKLRDALDALRTGSSLT